MTAPRRCYIHIGLQNTRTSFLQSILWQSTDQLREQGFELLPGTRAGAYHLMLAVREALREGIDPPKAFTVLDRLPNQVMKVSTPHALITQESLAPATPTQARTLVECLDGFEVHVVVTVRDLARQIPSAWQQRMKARKVYPYERFRDAVVEHKPLANDFWSNQDLPEVLARWGNVVPADRIHVVTVPPPRSQTTVLLDRFCSVLRLDPARLDTDSASRNGPASRNGSLGVAQAELLRRVNIALADRLPHPRQGYAAMGELFLAGEILAPQRGLSVKLPSDMADWCIDIAQAWVVTVAEGGYDVVGDLDELVPDRSAFTDSDPDVADEDVLDSAAEALATILDLRSRETAELAELRERLETQEEELRALRQGR